MNTNHIPPQKTPSARSKQPHPFVILVLLPLVLFVILFVAVQTSFFFSLPLWVYVSTGGGIVAYGIYRDIRRQFEQTVVTVSFKSRSAFYERFMGQMENMGFITPVNTPNEYTFVLDPRSSRYGIGTLFPSAWFCVDMRVYETTAELQGNKMTMNFVRRILQRQIQEDQHITLPY